MASEEWRERTEALENRVNELETEVRQRAIDAGFVYVHSGWTLIRLYLIMEQDRSGEGSETYGRAKNAQEIIHHHLARNLRAIRLEPKPMDAAYRWCIETTTTLQQNGYTFFDSA